MNIKANIFFLLAALYAPVHAHAQPSEQSTIGRNHPFAKYHQAADHIYVANPSQFQPSTNDNNREIDNKRDVSRHLLGKVFLSPALQVSIVRETPLTHGASSIELIDARTKKQVASFDLGLVSPENVEGTLLFTGQGVVYFYRALPYICGGEATQKFALRGTNLIEVKQPFLSINYTAETSGEIKLFNSKSPPSQVIAELPNETQVQVIGVVSDSEYPLLKEQYPGNPAMLVRTPLGLVGWYLGTRSGGSLSITNCN